MLKGLSWLKFERRFERLSQLAKWILRWVTVTIRLGPAVGNCGYVQLFKFTLGPILQREWRELIGVSPLPSFLTVASASVYKQQPSCHVGHPTFLSIPLHIQALSNLNFYLVPKIPPKKNSAYITMFSKVLFKLTAIVLFCISATSASATPHPVNGQPEEAQNINGDIHARASTYKPYLCEDPFRWVKRECVPTNGPMAWQDVCVWNSFATINDYKPGSCPFGYTCLDSYNQHGVFISCISDDTGKPMGKRGADAQWGVSATKKGRTKLGNTQQQFSITVDHDMNQASVAAVFESECHS